MRVRGPVLLVVALLCAAPLAAQDSSDIGVRTAQADAERARREFDRAAADARAQAAADRMRMGREESERLASDARQGAEAATERQRALAIEYARRRAESQAQQQAAQSEADLVRSVAEQRVRAAEDELRRAEERSAAEQRVRQVPVQDELLRRRAVEPLTAPRRRTLPAPEVAAPRPQVPIEMKEGVALCQRASSDRWRCSGPLRITEGPIDARRGVVARACGADTVRDLGTLHGMRAFGCGFGIDPRSAAPGNRDVPALYRIDIPQRLTFDCRHETIAPTSRCPESGGSGNARRPYPGSP